MHPIARNILAVILGWIGGNIVNMALIQLGSSVLPIEGVDPNDMDALTEVLPSLSAKYFIFPFLAHALGTLAGAILAGLIAASYKMTFALSVGGLFLICGITVNYLLPGPIWFAVADIGVAYIPMGWLGGRIAMHFANKS